MEIPQVPLREDELAKERVSAKVRDDVRKYLAEMGVSLNRLGDEQRYLVVRYIKWKRDSRWVVPLFLFSAVIAACASVFFYLQIREKLDPVFLPKKHIVTVDEDGTELVRDVPPEIIAYVKDYGTFCAIFGTVSGCMLYTSIAGFFAAVGMLRSLRENRRMLEAFLPLVSTSGED